MVKTIHMFYRSRAVSASIFRFLWKNRRAGPGVFDLCVLFFAVGVVVYFISPLEPPWGLTLSLLGGAILGCGVWCWVIYRQVILDISWYMVGPIFFIFGLSYAQIYTYSVHVDMLVRPLPILTYTGVITKIEEKSLKTNVTMTVDEVSWDKFKPARLKVSFAGRLRPSVTDGILIGDRVAVRALASPSLMPVFPGTIDLRFRDYFSGISGFAFAVAPLEVLEKSECILCFENIRQNLIGYFRQTLPGQSGQLAAALLVGERSGISATTYNNFRGSGLAHLLAISGLHVGLVAVIVFTFTRWVLAGIPHLAFMWPIKEISAFVAVFFVGGYMVLSGFSVPTVRAFIMVSLTLMGIVLLRRSLSMRLVSLAILFVLLFNPSSVTSASFQMSFVAVSVLIVVYQGIQRTQLQTIDNIWINWLVRYMGSILISTVVAGLATGLLTAVHFNKITTYGAIANFIAIPLTGLWIIPLGLLSLLLWPLGMADIPTLLLGEGLDIIQKVAEYCAHLPKAEVLVSTVSWPILVVIVSAFALIFWARSLFVQLGAVGVCLICFLSIYWASPPDIILSRDGRSAGVRFEDKLYVFGEAKKSFKTSIWSQKMGLSQVVPFNSKTDLASPNLTCDVHGCVFLFETIKVIVSVTPLGFWQDCRITLESRESIVFPVGEAARFNCERGQIIRKKALPSPLKVQVLSYNDRGRQYQTWRLMDQVYGHLRNTWRPWNGPKWALE